MFHHDKKPRDESAPKRRLRVLTLNIQVGMQTEHYRHYFTGMWRHVLPSRGVRSNLDRIAELASDYDVVALQECDAGSLRTQQLNQVEYLASSAGFTHWQAAINRDLKPFARHCLGFLSRYPLHEVRHHPLPGRIPGRGALQAELRLDAHAPLRLVVTHLALNREARTRQLDYLGGLAIPDADTATQDTVILGDLNCEPQELREHQRLRAAGLTPAHAEPTFPSWRPTRSTAHVLSAAGVSIVRTQVLDNRLSDHLPVATEIALRPN